MYEDIRYMWNYLGIPFPLERHSKREDLWYTDSREMFGAFLSGNLPPGTQLLPFLDVIMKPLQRIVR